MRNKKNFILLLICLSIFFLLRPYYLFLSQTLKISPLKTILSLDSLKVYDNNVTVLILGIAGGNHDGATLSDSIMVANYNLKTHKLLIISVPRDIWSDTLQDKINTAYAYGEAKQKNGGLKLAKAEVEGIVGIPIQYALLIDFAKFKELIDLLGGIDVFVDKSFTDKQFPLTGRENDECGGDPELKCRYESVTFSQGMNHLDGTLALKYVRSRHAQGLEGSDFARNKRQQNVLQAVKKKLISLAKNPDVKEWKNIYNILDKLIIRDISNQQIAIIIKNIIFSRNFSQKNITLSDDLFTVPALDTRNGQYTLIPKTGDYSEIYRYIRLNAGD